jgi:hypothetical protein
MANMIHEGNTTIWWVTSIASVAAPTVAEINAGVDLTPFVTKDGLKIGSKSDRAKNDDISSPHQSELPGGYGEAPSLTCKRDSSSDTAWNTLSTRGTAGYLVVRRLVAYGTAVAAGQKVEVYPSSTLEVEVPDTAENERVKFTTPLVVTSAPNKKSTVA